MSYADNHSEKDNDPHKGHSNKMNMKNMDNSEEPKEAADKEVKKKERKIRYYKHPMGLGFSSYPKKDQMGMDYMPVYEDEENNTGK